ncbi:MAG TPA: FecR domain-containing protein [Mucilaginibacter sp.]|jgi:transmembrane sensor|nr:FecR domain-containing protein [Mucilaginibacter sp.]
MEKPEQFSTYTLGDLLDHPGFVAWVLDPNQQAEIYWNNIQRQFPGITPLIAEARKLILTLHFEAEFLTAAEQAEIWQGINEKLTDKNVARVLPLWLRAAAAVLIVGLGFTLFLLNRSVTYSTGYGETKTLVLPDSTHIILNSNSSIHYAANWTNDKPREIWLTGEAYFQVRHLHRSGNIMLGERFIAHAGKANIEVLGTSFNLSNRRGMTDASLIDGRIRFTIPGKKGVTTILQPGDQVQYIATQDTLIKKKGNPGDFSGWKKGELHFDHTPASEIFQYLEDTYGYKITVKDNSILKKTLSGTFKSNNKKALLRTIAAALGVSIELSPDGKTLIFHY